MKVSCILVLHPNQQCMQKLLGQLWPEPRHEDYGYIPPHSVVSEQKAWEGQLDHNLW